METVMSWLADWTYWHWWALAVLLLSIEIFVPSTFFLWPAASAGVMGILVLVFGDFDRWVQLLIYALLSGVSTVLWFRWQAGRRPEEEDSTLNSRAHAHIGRKLRLKEALADGNGRMRIDDTWWSARSASGKTLHADTLVEIVDAESTVLIVRPVDNGG